MVLTIPVYRTPPDDASGIRERESGRLGIVRRKVVNRLIPGRTWGSGFAFCCLALMLPGPAQGQVATFGRTVADHFLEWTGRDSDGVSPITVKQLARLIDDLDKKLYGY